MDLVRRAITVRGRVQGVSFRYYTDVEANRFGLVGWVRNDADGSVRIEAQGPDEDVTNFVRWVRSGPPAAVVDEVEVRDVDPVPGEDRFRVTR